MRIRSNWVYVIPPNSLMAISDGVFTLAPRSKNAGQHFTVNFFMRSLAEERRAAQRNHPFRHRNRWHLGLARYQGGRWNHLRPGA